MDNITFKASISRNIVFKTLLLKGEAGNNIESIEKTATNVLVDTYTVTLTDGTTTTFQVTNGKGISEIELTGSSGIVDTYTITFNDGTTSTFEVTNGRGITNIAKTATNVLVDTYTITYNDNTTSTFNVTNGKGITDVSKTSTSGYVDTYTITYNDGTTSTFDVTNGIDYTVPEGGVIAYDGNDTPEGYEDYAGTVGAGHVIETYNGTDMAQRPNLQFLDAQLADDSQNERTKVEVVKQITEQELQNSPDGLYLIPDGGGGAVLDAEDVGFTPPTGMSATNVDGAIKELNTKLGTNTRFELTNWDSSITTWKEVSYGFYNSATKWVHINLYAYSTTNNIPTNAILAKVPQEYRPSRKFLGLCTLPVLNGTPTNALTIDIDGGIRLEYYLRNDNVTWVFGSIDYFIE